MHGLGAKSLQFEDFIGIGAHLHHHIAHGIVTSLAQQGADAHGNFQFLDWHFEGLGRDAAACGFFLQFFGAGFFVPLFCNVSFDAADEVLQALVFLRLQDAVFALLCQNFLDGGDFVAFQVCEGNVFRVVLQAEENIADGFGQALDVNAPASQLGCQAGVLSVAADGQAQLVFGDDDRSGLGFAVRGKVNPQDARRAERLGDVYPRVGVPLNDIDFFILQFAHDGLNAHAANANARADGVNAGTQGVDGYFGALAGFAGDRADFDLPVVNLWHFVLQQAHQEFAVGAGEDDLRAATAGFDFQQQGAYPVVHAEAVASDLFLARQNALGFHIQADGDIPVVDGLYYPAHDFPHLMGEVLVLQFTFGFAQALLNDLSGRLGGHAPEIFGGAFHHHQVAQFGFRVDAAGFFQGDFGAFILDVFDHFFFSPHGDFSALRV